MLPYKSPLLSALCAVLLLAAGAAAQQTKIDIPYQRFVLPNGLTLLVHEDRKAPIVAVNIWYHVGSKNEKRGKTGFAHLFEHLMFNGSEHFNDDYFKVLEKIGATDLNGTTNNDRTNYFQNVPKTALDTVLWLESDRMGHLIKAIDKAKLDEQRGVVQNEKRQGENEPYGLVDEVIAVNTYPASHPYSWEVIGSMEDLNAASLEDVHEWFRTYYGPSNAVLVVAGDIDAQTAKAKVEKYFGGLPPGPPVQRQRAWVSKMTGSHRAVLEDRVPQSRLYKVWNIPQANTRESDLFTIAASILGQGKTSRLYKRLVYADQTATDVTAYNYAREIGGQFVVYADARPGVDLAKVETTVDEEIAKFLASGPTEAELQRAKTRFTAGFIRGVERIGGFGGKSDVLARGQTYAGNPEAYKKTLAEVASATPADIRKLSGEWLSDGVFALEVRPFPTYKAGADADRAKMPEPGTPPDAKMPKLQRATLSNGLKVILAERHEIPVVNFNLAVDAGYAADQGQLAGTGALAMAMLDEGTKTRKALEISEELEGLGANLSAGSNLDTSEVHLSALKSNLDKSLAIWADVILNPAFPEQDFLREQKRQLARIQREKAEPIAMALRVFPALLYGKTHAYGAPFTGSGTEATVKAITRDTLVKFHQTWFKPNNATVIVVGDTTLAEITPKLEALFANWKQGPAPKKNVAQVENQAKPSVYIVDKPGALQSVILAGQIAPPTNNPDEIAFETLNTLLGGMFMSRINMNLREDKHWAYGAGTFVPGARGQRPFIAYAPVQTDKTKESISELVKELTGIVKSRPATEEELRFAQDNLTLSLAGSRETAGAVSGTILHLIQFGLPDDYYDTYAGKIRALKTQDMRAVAEKILRPDALVWVIVGDRAKIESGVKDLKLADIGYLDADGNPVQ